MNTSQALAPGKLLDLYQTGPFFNMAYLWRGDILFRIKSTCIIMNDTTNPDIVAVPEAGENSEFETPSMEDESIARHEIDRMDVIRRFETGMYPYTDKIGRAEYEKEKARLQVELLKVQKWVKETGKKVVILFEGRDAAGKGGAIKRFMEHLNPRGARVVALEKPTVAEQTQWYFQRYINHLPSAGEIVLLDRSWYNRAGVERVMGFCDPGAYLEFMRQCPEIERMLVRSGILLFKYWFSVTQEEQRRRFESRKNDPLKQWKLSPIDQALDRQMGRLHRGQGSDVLLYRHRRRAVDHRQVGRQETRATELYAPFPLVSTLRRQGRGFGRETRSVYRHQQRSRHRQERPYSRQEPAPRAAPLEKVS
jgi:polyphosphate kinase 2